MDVFNYYWLIPLLPAAGALVNGLLGKRLPKAAVGAIACGTVFVAFLLAATSVYQLASLPLDAPVPPMSDAGIANVDIVPSERRVEVTVYEWISAGTFTTSTGRQAEMVVPVAYQLDPLSAVMLLVVTGVGFLIHVYSVGYMSHEKAYYRYFTYLNLFMFSMLNLVMGNNFLIMFVGWEGVGLCSYLLIGFYFDKDFAATAGKKAFVVNRIGDFGFVLGMLFVFHRFGTLDFSDVMHAVTAPAAFAPGDSVLTAIALCLFVGATGKSAQIPLFVWLPDAMAGPTPVSALIHAATMVTSGIYMIVRCNPIYSLAPSALLVVAVVAGLTAFMAASIGLVQNDIKKVLAYSTVSQLGYMFLGLGVGAYAAGLFHVVTHAFFKALLFLGSGSVIHAMSGEQDIRKMGGLWKRTPITAWTFLIGCIAIAGIPPFAGFFSKDEILWKTYSTSLPAPGGFPIGPVLWGLAAVTAAMTAFYMFRLFYITFWGECRADKHVQEHIHESPAAMTGPLAILAVLSMIGGFAGVPHSLGGSNRFEQWLEPVIWHPGSVTEHPVTPGGGHAAPGHGAPAEHGAPDHGAAGHGGASPSGGHEAAGAHEVPTIEYVLMLGSVLLASASIFTAYRFYVVSPSIPAKIAAAQPGLYQLLLNKYWVDEIYEVAFVRSTKWLCARLGEFDLAVVDGVVNGVAALTRGVSLLSMVFDKYVVDGIVNFAGWICEEGSYVFRRTQTGYIQNYIYLTVFALLGILGMYMIRALPGVELVP